MTNHFYRVRRRLQVVPSGSRCPLKKGKHRTTPNKIKKQQKNKPRPFLSGAPLPPSRASTRAPRGSQDQPGASGRPGRPLLGPAGVSGDHPPHQARALPWLAGGKKWREKTRGPRGGFGLYGCGSNIGTPNGTLASGAMDQSLRSYGGFILTHTHLVSA